MANSLISSSVISKESLRMLKNELGFAKGVNRQYDDAFAQKGAKIGDTLNIRKPNRFTVSSGATLSLQDITEASVALQLSSQKHVDFTFTSKDLTLTVDEFSDRYLKPAVVALANQIDYDGLALYKNVANAVGTPGTVPATFDVMASAAQKLDEMGTPRDGQRSAVLNPAGQAGIVTALKGLFQSSEQIKNQYEKGLMGMAAGFTWKMDQNVNVHTVGPLGGTPLVNGASQTGSTLVTDGWTAAAASRLKQGDVFTIAGVNAVNPQSRQSTGALQQFVVTADVSSDGSGNASIPIYPAITTSGATQTVTASPADNAAITVLGAASTATPANLAYHKDAFVLAMADLAMPQGVDMAARSADPDAGLSIRMVRAYDISNDTFPCRLDVLYGWKAVYPELAVRIMG
jgi:hypothetical protein